MVNCDTRNSLYQNHEQAIKDNNQTSLTMGLTQGFISFGQRSPWHIYRGLFTIIYRLPISLANYCIQVASHYNMVRPKRLKSGTLLNTYFDFELIKDWICDLSTSLQVRVRTQVQEAGVMQFVFDVQEKPPRHKIWKKQWTFVEKHFRPK